MMKQMQLKMAEPKLALGKEFDAGDGEGDKHFEIRRKLSEKREKIFKFKKTVRSRDLNRFYF